MMFRCQIKCKIASVCEEEKENVNLDGELKHSPWKFKFSLSSIHFEFVFDFIIIFGIETLQFAHHHTQAVLRKAQIIDFQPIKVCI